MKLDDLVNVFDEAARSCNLKNANRGKYEQQKEGERAGIVAVVRALGPVIFDAHCMGMIKCLKEDLADREFAEKYRDTVINQILGVTEGQAGGPNSNAGKPSEQQANLPADGVSTPATNYCEWIIEETRKNHSVWRPRCNGKRITLYYIQDEKLCIGCGRPIKFLGANRLPMPAIRSEG